ncbi:hypothetical protein PHMEG_00024172 [Phytophthora megakarya]|uniref:Chromo domain-containing protein n=1 Tax=Phytophthora megakarya TaxID=4795 RepID=A0A225VF56_9STRA|nr:hypothetical protein PHMEG_00024172 [Phytophthora megakarya]
MKFYHDRNRPTATYQVSDEVLLNTSNLALHHVGSEVKRPLAAKYVGPYPVLAVTTPDTYKLGIPPGPQLHDEFHVSRLRPYTPDDSVTRDNHVPELTTKDGSVGLQVKKSIGHRVARGVSEYHVQWYGGGNADSWEPESNLVQAQGLIDAFNARAASTRPTTRLQASRANRYDTS